MYWVFGVQCVMQVLEDKEAAWGHLARGPIFCGHLPLVDLEDSLELTSGWVNPRVRETQVGDPLADTGKYPHN